MIAQTGKQILDVIVVGGGPAGCNAALVLARSRRKVLLIDEGKQRNQRSRGIHTFLTRDGMQPKDFMDSVYKELDQYEVEVHKARVMKARKLGDKGFEVQDDQGNCYLCKRILLATGVIDIIPDVPGMQELWGQHVFHCPFCDGWECHQESIGLYAKKFNGYGMALALKHLCSNVTLFTDGVKYLRTQQRAHLVALNIDVVSEKIKQLTISQNKLNGVELVTGQIEPIQSMFVLHGHEVNNELLQQLRCRCTKKGAAITNRSQQTSVAGVYVAGDAAFDMHFVTVAAAEGLKAAVAIHDDLLKNDKLF